MRLLAVASISLLSSAVLGIEPAAPIVEEITLKDGIQPQLAAASDGTLHQIYYKGDPKAGDLFYVTLPPETTTWSAPIRVNSEPGSAIAVGNDRGGQIALGRNGIVHVAWNGSSQISIGSEKTSPMLYARLVPGSKMFESQRNLMTRTSELDGGGSVAADTKGNVFVVWHAHPIDSAIKGESARRVFIAVSRDEGATFAPEIPFNDSKAGVCGCCGLKAQCLAGDDLLILYRAATQGTHRDMHLMRSKDAGKSFTDVKLDDWERNACPMSTASISAAGPDAALAWETDGEIHWCTFSATSAAEPQIHSVGDKKSQCKYPSIVERAGHLLVAWTQGMRWDTPGTMHWAELALDGSPLSSGGGQDVPTWSLISAAVRPDGRFVIVH